MLPYIRALIIIYKNDLPLSIIQIYSNIHLLLTTLNALTCMITCKSQSDAIQLQSDLDHLTHWSLFWRLLYNELIIDAILQEPQSTCLDSNSREASYTQGNHRELHGADPAANLDWSNHRYNWQRSGSRDASTLKSTQWL